MDISIKDPSQIMSHVLLGDDDLVENVAASEAWKEAKEIKGVLTFNGVEVSSLVVESAIKKLLDQVEKFIRKKYDADNIDNLVEERAKKLLKEHAGNALESIYSLTEKLEHADELITPHWDRTNNNHTVG